MSAEEKEEEEEYQRWFNVKMEREIRHALFPHSHLEGHLMAFNCRHRWALRGGGCLGNLQHLHPAAHTEHHQPHEAVATEPGHCWILPFAAIGCHHRQYNFNNSFHFFLVLCQGTQNALHIYICVCLCVRVWMTGAVGDGGGESGAQLIHSNFGSAGIKNCQDFSVLMPYVTIWDLQLNSGVSECQLQSKRWWRWWR